MRPGRWCAATVQRRRKCRSSTSGRSAMCRAACSTRPVTSAGPGGAASPSGTDSRVTAVWSARERSVTRRRSRAGQRTGHRPPPSSRCRPRAGFGLRAAESDRIRTPGLLAVLSRSPNGPRWSSGVVRTRTPSGPGSRRPCNSSQLSSGRCRYQLGDLGAMRPARSPAPGGRRRPARHSHEGRLGRRRSSPARCRSSGAGLLRLDFDAIRAGCATSSVGSGGVRRGMEASDFGYHSGEHSGGRCARPPRMASMVMPSFAA